MSTASFGTASISDDRASLSTSRSSRSSRALPGSRAIVGGLLVAVAVVGTYALATGMTSDPTRSVVVASHDLPAGTRLTAADVRVIDSEISGELAKTTIGSTAIVIGTTLMGPIKSGEMLQSGSLTAKASAATQPEVSFAIPASRALAAGLLSGETVDILVTDKNSTAVAARTAVSGATVLKVGTAGNNAIGGAGDVTVTVSVRDRGEAAALAAAVDSGQVTLVRTTGVATAAPTGTPDGA